MGITRVAIAGSSGSVGMQTIEVVLAEPDKYRITALAVGSSSDTVIEQARLLKPELVVVTNEALRSEVATALPGIPVTGNLADVVDVAASLHGQILKVLKIHNPAQLPELVKRLDINLVLLAMPSASRQRRNEIVELRLPN